MRFPQVSDRVKEAPAQALRGVFAGIGQLLLFTDKLRNKTPTSQQVPRARVPQPSETAPDTAPPLRETAPPLPDTAPPLRDAAPPTADAAPLEQEPEPTANPPSRAARVAEARDFDKTGNVRLLGGEKDSPASGAAPPATPEPAPAPTGEAPLPNYDELSVASLRARLRNLDVTQVRQLAEYERAHAARADVLTMFERRIAKLEAEA